MYKRVCGEVWLWSWACCRRPIRGRAGESRSDEPQNVLCLLERYRSGQSWYEALVVNLGEPILAVSDAQLLGDRHVLVRPHLIPEPGELRTIKPRKLPLAQAIQRRRRAHVETLGELDDIDERRAGAFELSIEPLLHRNKRHHQLAGEVVGLLLARIGGIAADVFVAVKDRAVTQAVMADLVSDRETLPRRVVLGLDEDEAAAPLSQVGTGDRLGHMKDADGQPQAPFGDIQQVKVEGRVEHQTELCAQCLRSFDCFLDVWIMEFGQVSWRDRKRNRQIIDGADGHHAMQTGTTISLRPRLFLNRIADLDWLIALEFGRVDEGQPPDAWTGLSEHFGFLFEDDRCVGFKVLGFNDFDLEAPEHEPIWCGPRFDAPTLALTDASAGEVILAARTHFGTRASINRHFFGQAIQREGFKDELGAWIGCVETGDSMAHYGLGIALLELGGSPARAYTHLRFYASIAPYLPWAQYWYARAAMAINETAEARAAAEAALDLGCDDSLESLVLDLIEEIKLQL